MNSIQLIADFCAGGLLLATFLMLGKIRLNQMLRYFILASFFLAALGLSVALMRGDSEPYVAPLATVLFKVIAIPSIIYYTSRKIPSSNQLKMYVRPATTYVLFALILVLSAFIVRGLPASLVNASVPGDIFLFPSVLFISIVLILSGILLMIIRKDLFSQVLGIITLENGISAFGLIAIEGMPIFLKWEFSLLSSPVQSFWPSLPEVFMNYIPQEIHQN